MRSKQNSNWFNIESIRPIINQLNGCQWEKTWIFFKNKTKKMIKTYSIWKWVFVLLCSRIKKKSIKIKKIDWKKSVENCILEFWHPKMTEDIIILSCCCISSHDKWDFVFFFYKIFKLCCKTKEKNMNVFFLFYIKNSWNEFNR